MKEAFTEYSLVYYLKMGDHSAIHFLYDRYAGALYAVILNEVNNTQAASDILEEVFKKIIRDIENYKACNCRLFTWLLRETKEVLRTSNAMSTEYISPEKMTGALPVYRLSKTS